MNLDFNQIQEIIRLVSKHKLSEFVLKEGEFKLVVRNQTSGGETPIVSPLVVQAPAQPAIIAQQPMAPAPAAAPPAAKPEPAPAATQEDANLLVIKASMIGTFYRRPSKDKPPFVEVGDVIDEKTKVCIIEAMKLFNEIEAEVKGKIVKILVEDGAPVDFGKPMFLVEPI